MFRRSLILALVALMLCGCIFGRAEQILKARLGSMSKSMGVKPMAEPRLLIYRVDGHDGRWTYQIAISPNSYAELRTRDDGRSYAFGRDARGAWLTVGDRPAVSANGGPWDALARTRSALFRLAFARPRSGDEVEYIGRDHRRWEMAYRPAGGSTMTFSIDRLHDVPREMDLVDEWTRIVSCDRLAWEPSPDGSVLVSSRCAAGNTGGQGNLTLASQTLLSMEGMAGLPSWAGPETRRVARRFSKPATVPMDLAQRVLVPVRMQGKDVGSFLLDSGSMHTVLSAEVAEEAGVVPTGEAPIFVDPPFRDRSQMWVGVVDSLQVGPAVLYAERVLVAENPRMLGPLKGLLGQSFFRSFVVDIDSPAQTVRIWHRSAFKPAADQQRMALRGFRPRIDGEIRGVARGEIMLDTAMTETILVSAPTMAMIQKRERGTDAHLGTDDAFGSSPDYRTQVRGLRFGPFPFPRMDAVARDRNREALGIGVAIPTVVEPEERWALDLKGLQIEILRQDYPQAEGKLQADLGNGIAIAGMGLMRYLRLSFDMRAGWLFASSGENYQALLKIGADIEDGVWGPSVGLVVHHGVSDAAGLRPGDVLLAVDDVPVGTAAAALTRILAFEGYYLHIEVMRGDKRRHLTIDVAHSQ